jgi:hypothetical protein
MEGIDPDLEDEILWRVANRVDRTLQLESTGDSITQHDPDMITAMQLTGGYVKYLRDNASELMASIQTPESALKRCINLGKFVAYMRARPSKLQDENVEREFAARLVSQQLRLAKFLAVVLNRKIVDDEVLRRTTAVALDTARGTTMQIAKYLHMYQSKGLTPDTLLRFTNQTPERTKSLLRFLRMIGAVEVFTDTVAKGLVGKPKWRLTPRVYKLYNDVVGNAEVPDES